MSTVVDKYEYTGIILGYRRGSNTQYTEKVLVKIPGVESRSEASGFIGRKILCVDRHGNTYRGKIIGVHGNRGVLIAVFKPRIPGQLIGSSFYVISSKKSQG